MPTTTDNRALATFQANITAARNVVELGGLLEDMTARLTDAEEKAKVDDLYRGPG